MSFPWLVDRMEGTLACSVYLFEGYHSKGEANGGEKNMKDVMATGMIQGFIGVRVLLKYESSFGGVFMTRSITS